jgi:hypothetical protein
MTFVTPLLLAGAGLVVVPIVLHLVMRRKPRLVEFPALRFVRRRHDTNQRQLRLRHLLLLLLRTLAIALAAFALARPSLKFSGGAIGSQRAPVAAVFVFDTSKRMEYRHENRTRLEAAQELALWLLAQLPPESKIAVLDSRRGSGDFQVDMGAAKHRMERLETTADAQPLPSAVAEAARLLAGSTLARKEIYVFTDLTRVAWPVEAAGRMQEQLAQTPDAGMYLIDVGVQQPANLALGDLRLSGQIVSSRSTLKIDADLISVGMGDKHTVELHLLESDPTAKDPGTRKPQKRGEKTVTLQPGQSQQMEFRVGNLGLGTHQGYVQILGQDGLAADDRRYFTVEAKPPWQILLAAPKPAKEVTVFLAQALAPDPRRRAGLDPFELTVVDLDELLKTDLARYAAVCLVDPRPLDAPTWQKLADYVAEGHGLAVFLGRNAEEVKSFNENPAQLLLAGRLLRQARSPDETLRLDPRNLEHPVLAEFRKFTNVPWSQHPVYRYWQLDTLPEGVHVIAPFSDDAPAILERPLGKGRSITMTTPVSDDPNRDPWNLLPVGSDWPPFVILAHQMMAYLVGSGGQELNYRPGEVAALELDPGRTEKSYLLTGPDGVQARITPDLKQHRLVVTSTDQPGNYRVQAGGPAEGVDRGFSVNLSPEQTRLDRHADKDLAQLFGTFPYRIARSKDQIELNVSTGRVGRELFGLLILAAAVILGLEHVMANGFYRRA